MFVLAPELQRDTFLLAQWALCDVLLMNDRQYPWFILVPRVAEVTEIIDLTEAQQAQLQQESVRLSHLLRAQFVPHKLNIAALGNMVPQLHIHHIARFTHDAAWPAPVWGKHPAVAYSASELKQLKTTLQPLLTE